MHIKVLLCAMCLFLGSSIGFGSYLLSLEEESLLSPLPDQEKTAVKGVNSLAILPPTFSVTITPVATVNILPTVTPTTPPQLQKNVTFEKPTNTPTPTQIITPTPTIPVVTPTIIPSPTPTLIPIGAPADLESLFSKYASEYGVDKELMKKIAQCESGMNASSHNKTYDYGGMFQFASSSWIATRNQMGMNTDTSLRFNAEEAIRTAAFKISRGGVGAWPHCSKV